MRYWRRYHLRRERGGGENENQEEEEGGAVKIGLCAFLWRRRRAGVCATVLRCVRTHTWCLLEGGSGRRVFRLLRQGRGEIKPLAHRTVDIGEMPLLLPPPPMPEFLKLPSALLPIFGFPRGDSVEKWKKSQSCNPGDFCSYKRARVKSTSLFSAFAVKWEDGWKEGDGGGMTFS